MGKTGELTDGQLLERFSNGRGEEAELAFATLVDRHGPLVLGVCRGVLADLHDAQDAFQATFLILVKKAPSLWVRDSLAPWLCRVACRAASRARSDAVQRRRHERWAAQHAAVAPIVSGDDYDHAQTQLLHEEINRLPERYRIPVVLCDLEGYTHEQAARCLKWPVGTVKSRQARGRERLRGRLTRRGLAPLTGLPFAGLSPAATRAAIPAGLLNTTVRAASKFAEQSATTTALSSTTAVSLARGVIYTMMTTKLKILGEAALACILTIGGFHALGRQAGGPGAPGQAAGTEPKPNDPHAALVRTVNKLQANLDRSALLNANLQKELQDLRADLEALARPSRWLPKPRSHRVKPRQ